MDIYLFRLFLFVFLTVLAAACGAPPMDPAPPSTAEPNAADAPVASPPAMSVPEAAPNAGQQLASPTATPSVLTQAEIEQLVLADLSARQGLAPAEARIIASDLRRWPNPNLDCSARPGVFEPQPTPGYLIRIEAGGRIFEYHTDLHGKFLLCPSPAKPLDPIR